MTRPWPISNERNNPVPNLGSSWLYTILHHGVSRARSYKALSSWSKLDQDDIEPDTDENNHSSTNTTNDQSHHLHRISRESSKLGQFIPQWALFSPL